MTHLFVPDVDGIRGMPDDELAGFAVELTAALADIQVVLAAGPEEDRRRRLLGARAHYERGIRTVRAEQAARSGQPIFRAARDVVDYSTATAALKAVNRLLGLLNDEHFAVAKWLAAEPDSEDDEVWLVRVEEAHRMVADAYTAAVTP